MSREVALTVGRVAFAPAPGDKPSDGTLWLDDSDQNKPVLRRLVNGQWQAEGGVVPPSKLPLVGEQPQESVVRLRQRSYGPSLLVADPLRIFIGYDPRQPATVAVLSHSITRRASRPVAITPLVIEQLPIKRQGLTPFTFTRYLVPWLCGYRGLGLFLDADELVLGDVAQLFACADRHSALQVVKNRHRFEWPSVMLFDCAHYHNRALTPEYVETTKDIAGLPWTDRIGELPSEWNHLVGYDAPRPDVKLVHYTQGVPAWDETRGCEHSDAWTEELRSLLSMEPWDTIMGPSVHAVEVDGKRVPRFRLNQPA